MTCSDEDLRLLRELREAVRCVSLYKERLALRDASDRQLCEVLRRKAREALRESLKIAAFFVLFALVIERCWQGVVFIAACMAGFVLVAVMNHRKSSALAMQVERVLEREARVAPS
jgi:hypothetical protein